MMGIKNYRSEEEHLLSLLDKEQGPFARVSPQEDPVIFYSPTYERKLLMEYGCDFGGESSSPDHQNARDDEEEQALFIKREQKLDPSWFMSPSESEDVPSIHSTTPELPIIRQKKHVTASSRFNPYSSGPLVKEPCSMRNFRGNHHYRDESPKRGRPSKATSNTKMANYARNYREQKKNEMATMQMRNQELEAEVKLLLEENSQMKKTLVRATEEIQQLKKVIDQDSQIARVVANMGGAQSNELTLGARPGVCVHVGSLGTTVEVCKACADNNKERLDSKFKVDEELELFDEITPQYSWERYDEAARMSTTQFVQIVVEYSEETACSPSPSTSNSSSGSSTPKSSASAPKPSKTSRKSSMWRQSSRKSLTAGRAKYAKKYTSASSSSSKMRLVKYKIDKQHQERLAASKARVERLQREREELLAGNSQLAIMCESVTTSARSLRESYERQRSVYRAIISSAALLEHVVVEPAEGEDGEEAEDEGFIGTIYY
ncbi:unnamed protein product [Caenorhabditis sp. 36 PRJEB53466]|nr:unnamed protein product [Caenorhabditis sp. 36 PRJEB53466]